MTKSVRGEEPLGRLESMNGYFYSEATYDRA